MSVMVQSVVHGPKILTSGASHFVGFHDLTPWNEHTDELVCLRTDVAEDHVPLEGEAAEVIVVDNRSGEYQTVAATYAWNWQKAARQRFLPALGQRIVAFNSANEDRLICRIVDLSLPPRDRELAQLPAPIYDFADGHGFGLTLDFIKLTDCQPGYGYVHRSVETKSMAEDGIWRVELTSGDQRQILSMGEFLRENGIEADLGRHYFTHIQISPDGAHYAFIHRCFLSSGALMNHLVVGACDGSGHRIVHDDKVSHFDWADPRTLIAWCRHNPAVKALKESRLKDLIRPLYRLSRQIRANAVRQNLYNEAFRAIDIETLEKRVIGRGTLVEDGHPQVNPVHPHLWVNDTYPDGRGWQTLMVYDTRSNRRTDLLSLPTPASLKETIWRCDFHPRWKPTGDRICFDSAHGGRRQVCLADVPAELIQ